MDPYPILINEYNLNYLQNWLTGLLEFMPRLIAALVFFILGLYLAGLLSKLLRRTMERRDADPEITLLFSQIVRWTVIVLGMVVSLQHIGFNLSAFVAGLGILGFTIGFAIQDVSKNFVAGLLLLLQQPFDIGDTIEVNDYAGTVLNIDLRATELRTFDGKHVLIPNADVFTSPITNYSRDPKRRVELAISVAFDSDLESVRETTLSTVAAIPGVLTDPVPSVIFNNFGNSSIDFNLYFWVDTRETGLSTARDTAVVGINSAFKQSGITIPFPTQMVYLQQ